jgi:hypothetical protein
MIKKMSKNKGLLIGLGLLVLVLIGLIYLNRGEQPYHFIENHSEIKRDTDFIFDMYREVEARHMVTIHRGRKISDSVDNYIRQRDTARALRLIKQVNMYWYPLDRRQRDTMKRLLGEIGGRLIEK